MQRKGIKMTGWEDPELTSSNGHTKTTTIYRATLSEKNMRTIRTTLTQLKIQRKSHIKKGRGREVFWLGPKIPSMATHK